MARGFAAALLIASLACAEGAAPAACVFATECAQGETCLSGSCQLLPPTCPKIEASFKSINEGFFQVGCGAKSNKCHGTAAVTATVNGLDLQKDPYGSLLGPTGQGQPVDPVDGRPPGLLRVKPGDPAGSLLVVKLKLKSNDDPLYGASMPFDRPGAICDDTIAVISRWVAAGAANN